MNIVTVRWNDDYLEEFEATEVRFGSDLLWMRLADGNTVMVPEHYSKKGARYIRLEDARTLPVLPKEFRAEFRSIDEAFEAGWKQALECLETVTGEG